MDRGTRALRVTSRRGASAVINRCDTFSNAICQTCQFIFQENFSEPLCLLSAETESRHMVMEKATLCKFTFVVNQCRVCLSTRKSETLCFPVLSVSIVPFVTSQKAGMQKWYLIHNHLSALITTLKSAFVCSFSPEHVKDTTKHQIPHKKCAKYRKQRANYDLLIFFWTAKDFNSLIVSDGH